MTKAAGHSFNLQNGFAFPKCLVIQGAEAAGSALVVINRWHKLKSQSEVAPCAGDELHARAAGLVSRTRPQGVHLASQCQPKAHQLTEGPLRMQWFPATSLKCESLWVCCWVSGLGDWLYLAAGGTL